MTITVSLPADKNLREFGNVNFLMLAIVPLEPKGLPNRMLKSIVLLQVAQSMACLEGKMQVVRDDQQRKALVVVQCFPPLLKNAGDA
eukprot:6207337-Amphidinium_carterae.1